MGQSKNSDQLKLLKQFVNLLDGNILKGLTESTRLYIISLIIFILITINYTSGCSELLEKRDLLSFRHILLIIFFNIFVFKSYCLVYILTFRQKSFVDLWRNVNNLNELFNRLGISTKSNMKINFMFILSRFIFILLIHVVFTYMRIITNEMTTNTWFFIINYVITFAIRYVIDLQYVTINCVIKNYYKDLNELINSKINTWNVNDIKYLGICYLTLVETGELLQETESSLILIGMLEVFTIFVTNVYGLAALYIHNDIEWYNEYSVIWLRFWTLLFYLILFIIIPTMTQNQDRKIRTNLLALSNKLKSGIVRRKVR